MAGLSLEKIKPQANGTRVLSLDLTTVNI